MNKTIATIISTALLLTACDPEASISGTDEASEFRAEESFDGKELFAGIFFGQGRVAQYLPATWGDAAEDERLDALSRISPETMLESLDRGIERTTDRRLRSTLEKARDRLASGDTIRGEPRDLELIMELVAQEDPTYYDRLARAVRSGRRPAIQEQVRQGFLLLKGLLTVENSVIERGTEEGNAVAVVLVAVAVLVYVVVEIEVFKPGIEESLIREEMMVDEIAQQLSVFGY